MTEKQIAENFSYFASTYVALWVLAASLTHSSFGLDTLEGLVWGKEWLLGTYKHPTLPSWVLEIAWQVGGGFGVKAILPIFQMLTLWVVYLFARIFVSPQRALLSALLVALCFAWRSFDNVFNHNTAQPLFWVLVIYLFYLGLNNRKLYWWILLGAAAAACFWIKYNAIFLLLCVPLWLLIDEEARKTLKTPGPWVSLGVFLLLISPQVYFLLENNFSPLRYGIGRADRGHSGFYFLSAQLLTQLPLIFVLALTGFIGKGFLSITRSLSRADKFILYFAFVPLVLFVFTLIAFGQGFRTQWGYSFFPLMGLVAMRFFSGRFDDIKFTRAFYALLFFIFATPAANAVYTILRPSITTRASKFLYPQKTLSQAVESHFAKATGKEMKLIVGRLNIAGRAGIYMRARPQFLYEGSWKKSPWVDKRTACQATAIVWQGDISPAYFRKMYGSIMRLCKVKTRAPIKFSVPFARYKDKALDLNMIVISRD